MSTPTVPDGPDGPGEQGPSEQLSLPGLVRAEVRKAKPPAVTKPFEAAAIDPVARVLLEVPLAHLDRLFDYAVPASASQTAVPGARVKVRFAGQDVDGFIVERAAATDHQGRLQPLRRVVSAEPVLRPELVAVLEAVAARYAGTKADLLRLAVPPRHASTEKATVDPGPAWSATPQSEPFRPYPGGAQLIQEIAWASSPRTVWSVAPGDDWVHGFVEAAVAARAAGRGAILCVPDHRDLDRLDRAMTARLGSGHHVVLAADLGPAARYRSFLAVSRGHVQIVLGTRGAAFAPVHNLGLVAIWDDGDDLFIEPRAPYCHTRDVLLTRAQLSGSAVLLAGYARSVEAQYLVRSGWANELCLDRAGLRQRVQVRVAGDTDQARERSVGYAGRFPAEVFAVIRQALATGPVLVQAPRAGYATRLACDRCRTVAACATCHGPLRVPQPGAPPECTWCGRAEHPWHCEQCGGVGLRAPGIGDQRISEELGRAFPRIPVKSSAGDRILGSVNADPAIVVATPGAEPIADGGYSAVILLETGISLARSDLRAREESLRRWLNAAATVRPPDGARPELGPVPTVLAVGDPGDPAIQALVRWDPAGLAEREITERQEAHLPPASRVATLTATEPTLLAGLAMAELPPGAEVLGPVAVDDEEARVVVRVPRSYGAELAASLGVLQARRSARKEPHIRVQLDPHDLG